MLWTEFKPAIRFVLLFVGLYFAGNLVYGFYISSHGNAPDVITFAVAKQSSWILNKLGYTVNAIANAKAPTVFLKSGEITVLNVYEGCNGINVYIVFIAFIIAFQGRVKQLLWFIPMGIMILYFSNLLRIVLLYFAALNYHRYFYYVHKYIFTAVIYTVVLILWIIWVNQVNDRKKIIKSE